MRWNHITVAATQVACDNNTCTSAMNINSNLVTTFPPQQASNERPAKRPEPAVPPSPKGSAIQPRYFAPGIILGMPRSLHQLWQAWAAYPKLPLVPGRIPWTPHNTGQQWEAWAAAPEGQYEQREEALANIHAWVIEGDPTRRLNLSGLGLSSLPPHLPTNFINLTGNNLASIPNFDVAANWHASTDVRNGSQGKA